MTPAPSKLKDHCQAEVSVTEASLATPNYRSSIATIKNCHIHIGTWFINSFASFTLDK